MLRKVSRILHPARAYMGEYKRGFSRNYPGYQIENKRALKEDLKPHESSGSLTPTIDQIVPQSREMPLIIPPEDPVVMSFDDIPGPKTLKYFAMARTYLSELGTQLSACFLTMAIEVGSTMNKEPLTPRLFDMYGPVVRFMNPIGRDVVLVNNPEYIQKIYSMEGDYPVRSILDSLEKYRAMKSNGYKGIYSMHGEEWARQRAAVCSPLKASSARHMDALCDVCDTFVLKVNNIKDPKDELTQDLYEELRKWAFDCMGHLIFSKQFSMLQTDSPNNQDDYSWMYHSLTRATAAVARCEGGLHMWELFTTPAWASLARHTETLDNLIGKLVMEAEQRYLLKKHDDMEDIMVPSEPELSQNRSMIEAMLQDTMKPEEISTVLMDMLLIGVNSIATSMSFLLYHLAKYQRCQKLLHQELSAPQPGPARDAPQLKAQTPYLQACIKESLRLVPPIPMISRVLKKNIILDKYNIPRGTLIIMSTRDASLKERNYDDALKFSPERWLTNDCKDYHPFASVPFGHGVRKCLGQNISETLLSIMTMKILQKFKLEYHHGDIKQTRSFIVRPNKALKIRFIDRI